MDRLKITIEFNKSDIKELELYSHLLKFSRPGVIVKEILKGNIPLTVLEVKKENEL